MSLQDFQLIADSFETMNELKKYFDDNFIDFETISSEQIKVVPSNRIITCINPFMFITSL